MLLTPPTVSHHLRAILAVLLSLKKKPVIRWERMSQAGKKLASEVQVRPLLAEGQGLMGSLQCNILHIENCSISDRVLVRLLYFSS